MPTNILSDEQVAAIEVRNKSGRYPFIETVDALCATVRALREREKNYARVLSDRLREMNALSELVACEHNSDPDSDAEPCGTCQTCLQSENTALREQLAESERVKADLAEDYASALLRQDELQSQLAQVEQEPLVAAIDFLEQRRRQLGAESIPEYSRTINFLQAIIDEKKKEYPPLGVAESKRREDG